MLEIRCSGLARPMICAGYLFFTDLPQQESNSAAEEGTACGELLQHKLQGTTPGTHAKNGVPFDHDMEFYTTPIAKWITDRAESKVLCEERIDWLTRSGIMIRGQYDIAYVTDGGKTLNIDDLKYGYGLVEVTRNWQLIGYAIGEVIRRQQIFEHIVLRIHQPRPHHEDGPRREWKLTYPELLALKEEIEVRMEQIASGDQTLVTSKHCKYCPASGEACPAFNKAFFRGVEIAHEFMQDSIDDEELSFQLDLINRIEEIVKIKKDSCKALAIDRMKGGRLIKGWSMETSYGDRKWKPEITPETVMALTGVDIIEKVMVSPAKAEKLGVDKKFVNALVDRHFLGQKLVPKDATKLGDKIFGKGEPS